MSIIAPTFLEKYWKVIAGCVGALVLFGGVLLFFDKCSTYRGQNKRDKIQENINKTLGNVANLEVQKRELELKQAAELESANIAVKEFHDEVNATVEARKESNVALANVNAARNSNATNVSVQQLEELLRKLDQ